MTLVVACSSVSEDTTRADALEIIGCSAHPSCDDTFMGRYCLPACTPECTSRHMATGLWVSLNWNTLVKLLASPERRAMAALSGA